MQPILLLAAIAAATALSMGYLANDVDLEGMVQEFGVGEATLQIRKIQNTQVHFLDVSIMGLNLKSIFLSCQIFGGYFLENKIAGSIINLGSISGLIPLSRVFTYSMSKGAVHNLSKNLAREWAPNNIRVNTLVPGFFPAEQNRKVLTEDRVAAIMGHTPMNRFGETEELIGATLLLASQAGSFITGLEMVVDGGYASMTI